jgi:hypothetical protein
MSEINYDPYIQGRRFNRESASGEVGTFSAYYDTRGQFQLSFEYDVEPVLLIRGPSGGGERRENLDTLMMALVWARDILGRYTADELVARIESGVHLDKDRTLQKLKWVSTEDLQRELRWREEND